MRVLRPFVNQEGKHLGYNAKCPGCDMWHSVYTAFDECNKAIWAFNGNTEKPTFAPSLLVRYGFNGTDTPKHICHSFIRDGEWQFLGDCTHSLAGQTVPMVDIES